VTHALSAIPSPEAGTCGSKCRYWGCDCPAPLQRLFKASPAPEEQIATKHQNNTALWLKSTLGSPDYHMLMCPSGHPTCACQGCRHRDVPADYSKLEAGRRCKDQELAKLYPTCFTCLCTCCFTAHSMKPQWSSLHSSNHLPGPAFWWCDAVQGSCLQGSELGALVPAEAVPWDTLVN